MSPHASAAGRPLKVLHVDDDPLNLKVVQEILTAFGHMALSASSGLEGLQRLNTESFYVLLLDIHMPDMTGIEMLQRLRGSASPGRDIPAIALTADVISRRPQEYLALGFNDYVSKPILVSGLMASIQKAAEGPGRPTLSRAS